MEPDGRRAARPLAGRSFLSAGRRAAAAAAAAARPHARRGADGGRAGAAFPLFDGKPGPEALVLRGLAGAVPAGAHPVAAAGVVFCSVRVNGGGRRTPAAFLLLGGIALLWEYASAPGGVANVPFLGGYFVLRAPAQTAARLVMARALGAVGCLYFLSLSTPVPELLDALRRARVPEVVGDLAVLIYRYIFILFATFRSMRDAAASRLGYAGPVRSLRTTGRVYGGLLAHSFRRAQACFDAMESRCYDGGIRFLTREKPVRAPHALVCGALTAGMVLALVCGA